MVVTTIVTTRQVYRHGLAAKACQTLEVISAVVTHVLGLPGV